MPRRRVEEPHTIGAAVVPLPPFSGLTQQQVRGITCVWDGVALTSETAIDLGTRTFNRLGNDVQWFPRGCRSCTTHAMTEAIHDHGPRCEQCTDDASQCSTRRTLEQIAREARR